LVGSEGETAISRHAFGVLTPRFCALPGESRSIVGPKEVRARLHLALQGETDAQDEDKVDDHNGSVDEG
jgi:hypothetical protein